MKKSTPFWSLCGGVLLSISLLASNGEPAPYRPNFGLSAKTIKPRLTGLPVVKAQSGSVKIQSTAEYRVIDSLFNAYSFYGGEQQPLCYNPATGLFAIIKRGALPPENTGNPNNSNSLRLLISTDLGKSWQNNFALYTGGNNGAPRYPSVDISVPEGHTDASEAIFGFVAPLTKSSGTGSGAERTWDGSVIGYQANDAGTAAGTEDLTAEVDVNGSKFWWGTDCTTAAYQAPDASKLNFNFAVDLIPSDSASTPSELLNAQALMTKDFMGTGKAAMTIPNAWSASKFRMVESHSGAWRTHVGFTRDKAGNFYNATFGNFLATEDTLHHTFGVSKSTDHGATWGDFNVMPYSVFLAYANKMGVDTSECFFDWRRSSNDASAAIRLTSYAFVAYGNGNFSCFTQFYSSNTNVPSHLVECYYANGQWGMRKVADISMFENADFYRVFDQDGAGGPSQMGNELQACVTADDNNVILKFLEAKIYAFKNEDNADDTLLTTDVIICTRSASGDTWSTPKNVTQSNILDRTTWVPTIWPADMKNVPIVTVQTAEKGSTIREQLYESQMRMASSNSSSYDAYKQYVTISNFNVADLPEWDGLTKVGVSDDNKVNSGNLSISPNPASDLVTLSFNSDAQNGTLQVVNELGQVVVSQNIEFVGSGSRFYTMNTNQLASGTYIVRVIAASNVFTKSLNIVR